MEAHKPDLGIQILGLFNPKQGRKYRTYQFDLLITENEFKHIYIGQIIGSVYSKTVKNVKMSK